MQLGMVGLGKMGANMTERLVRGGHEIVLPDPPAPEPLEQEEPGRWRTWSPSSIPPSTFG